MVQFLLVKIMKVKAYLNYKKRVTGIIGGVSKQVSWRKILKDFNIQLVAHMYI